MTIQAMEPDFENKYPRRVDRLQEEPSAKNAQGLFPPDACIFVGNLSTKVAAEEMTESLKKAFTVYGPCHVKIKQDKKKGLPGAFVQFEKVEHANAALGPNARITLHDRWLRIERAKGRPQDVSSALRDRGPLEVYSIESYSTGPQTWTFICKVTFAYVDDCRDAIKLFQKDPNYFLTLLDMESNPSQNMGGRLSLRARPYVSSQGRNNNHNGSPRYNRTYRNGPNRGGYRGFPKYHDSPFQPENSPPSHPRGEFPPHLLPGPPYWINGMPYNNEPYPSLYHPPPQHPSNGLSNHQFIPNNHPGFDPPHLVPPPYVYNTGIPHGPLIVNGQLSYGSNSPAFYREMCTPESGFMSTPSSVASQDGSYFTTQTYTEPCMAPQRDLAPPLNRIKVSLPTAKVEETEEEVPECEGIEKLLEQKEPEKPPRLIRIYDSDTESDEEGEEYRGLTRKLELEDANHLVPAFKQVKGEEEEEEGKKMDVQERRESQNTEVTSDSGPLSADQRSTPSHSRSRSRSCSPLSRTAVSVHSRDLRDSDQEVHVTPKKTVAEIVRSVLPTLESDIDERLIQEVILEEEERMKQERAMKKKQKPTVDRGSSKSSTSRSCSLTRSCSSKSI
ncbi:hypothetical protein N7520_002668 [Penicillium odoratum]|uniref:uncharacterized protein n=1 Tax=Penicillium odoratum TaxID=1167516 RepID=UPI002547B6A3|nr:uncharacterized protein N7520_002668 [Penicillium odoratum]KAJ5772139.1 hypothetical protein N7520_002668 [Penicillium odoratum]